MKILNYIKLKNIINFLTSEIIISLSELRYNTKINSEDIIFSWEQRCESGKILITSDEIKNDIYNIFGTDDIKNVLIEIGYEIIRKKIDIIYQILNLNIGTNDKIDLLIFLIRKSSEELANEYLG